MRGRRIWGITLLYVGALTLLLGAAATFLPASSNRQIQMILGSFSVPSNSPVLNGFNNMMLLLIANCWAVLGAGALCVGAGILCLILSGGSRSPQGCAARQAVKGSASAANENYRSPAQAAGSSAGKKPQQGIRTVNCPVCGALNDASVVKCRRCGVSLSGDSVIGTPKPPNAFPAVRQDASLYAPPLKADAAVLRRPILPAELPVPAQGPAWDGETYPDLVQSADTAVCHRLIDTSSSLEKTALSVPEPATLLQHAPIAAAESENVTPHKISPRIVTTIHKK